MGKARTLKKVAAFFIFGLDDIIVACIRMLVAVFLNIAYRYLSITNAPDDIIVACVRTFVKVWQCIKHCLTAEPSEYVGLCLLCSAE